MRRREFLSIPVTALGGALLYTLAKEPFVVHAQQNGNVDVPLKFFTAEEAKIVAAAAARIFPNDASGPGANEAGVVIYIDRQLAGPYGKDKYRYTRGPWIQSVPEHGYQAKESPREVYKAGIPTLAGFLGLTPAGQDDKLRSIERTTFFQMLRTHTLEGMFSDPMHGGNKDMIGWQLIGFPGPRMSYRDDIDKHHGEAFRPKPLSLAQVLGRPVKGWEEEPV